MYEESWGGPLALWQQKKIFLGAVDHIICKGMFGIWIFKVFFILKYIKIIYTIILLY